MLTEQDVHQHVIAFINTIQSDAIWISKAEQAFTDYLHSENPTPQHLRSVLGIKKDVWPPHDLAFFPLIKDKLWSLLVIYRSQGIEKIFHYDPTLRNHVEHSIDFVRMLCFAELFQNHKHIRIKRISLEKKSKNYRCTTSQSIWKVILITQQIVTAGIGGGLTSLVLMK